MFVQWEQFPQVPDGRIAIARHPHVLGVGVGADGGCVAVENAAHEYL